MTSDDAFDDAPARGMSAGTSPRPAPSIHLRPWLASAITAAALVAAGLAAARFGTGPLGDALGDALYAALMLVLVAFVLPHRSRPMQALVALAVCWTVELAQFTGGPSVAVRAWPPLRYLLGTTFVATDLLAYALGVSLAAGGMVLASRLGGGTRRPALP